MKERMKDIDETIEAILGNSKAEVIEEFPRGQSHAVHATGYGNESAAAETWRAEGEVASSMRNEKHEQAGGCHLGAGDGQGGFRAMDKGLHFASFGSRVEEKLFFGNGTHGGSVDGSGIMDMKPFGSSELRPGRGHECSRTNLSDLEEILGLATDPDKSRKEHALSFESMEGYSRTCPGAAQDPLAKTQPASKLSGAFQEVQTDARWLRKTVGTGRPESSELHDSHHANRRPIFGIREHFGHRRAEDGHFLQGRGEECSIERMMGERPRQCAPTQNSRTDSLLFRNPMGSLDQMKSQVYYRIKKRRRLNSSTWNLGDSLSMVHPSRLSSLEFVSGCGMGSPHVPGCMSLPLILNTSDEMMPEGVGVAHRFKKIAESMDFSNVTVFQLKQLMRDYGLSHAGKKNDLIDRIKSTLREINSRLNVDRRVSEAESPKKDEDAVYDNFFF